jgi:hypothetical protein
MAMKWPRARFTEGRSANSNAKARKSLFMNHRPFRSAFTATVFKKRRKKRTETLTKTQL